MRDENRFLDTFRDQTSQEITLNCIRHITKLL